MYAGRKKKNDLYPICLHEMSQDSRICFLIKVSYAKHSTERSPK